MHTAPDVFCVGNAVVDLVVRPVVELPPVETIAMVDRIEMVTGGNGINMAIALARLGISVRVGGAVGDDGFGLFLKEALDREGVDRTGLVTLSDTVTGATVALVKSDGRRGFLHQLGANAVYAQSHIDWDLLQGTSVFHYGSTFVLPAFDGPPLEDAFRKARALGCRTSLDVCWDVEDRWLALLEPVLQHIDFLFCNEAEAQALSGESSPAAAARFLRARGAKTVLVKLGPAGCYVDDGAAAFSSPAFPVNAVDTTGAGDCFAAAFLTAHLEGKSLEQTARFANASGGFSVGASGGAGAPTRPEIESLLMQ